MWDRKGKGREEEGEGKGREGPPCRAGDSRTFHTLLEAQQLQDSAPLNLEGKFCSLFVFCSVFSLWGKFVVSPWLRVRGYFGSEGCAW